MLHLHGYHHNQPEDPVFLLVPKQTIFALCIWASAAVLYIARLKHSGAGRLKSDRCRILAMPVDATGNYSAAMAATRAELVRLASRVLQP